MRWYVLTLHATRPPARASGYPSDSPRSLCPAVVALTQPQSQAEIEAQITEHVLAQHVLGTQGDGRTQTSTDGVGSMFHQSLRNYCYESDTS